jgi:hypothetical protein
MISMDQHAQILFMIEVFLVKHLQKKVILYVIMIVKRTWLSTVFQIERKLINIVCFYLYSIYVYSCSALLSGVIGDRIGRRKSFEY